MLEQGDLQFAFAQPVQHFLGGKVVQDNARAGICFLKKLQRTRKKAGRQGRRVADVEFAFSPLPTALTV